MTPQHQRLASTCLALTLLTATAGCGNGERQSAPTPEPAPAPEPEPAPPPPPPAEPLDAALMMLDFTTYEDIYGEGPCRTETFELNADGTLVIEPRTDATPSKYYMGLSFNNSGRASINDGWSGKGWERPSIVRDTPPYRVYVDPEDSTRLEVPLRTPTVDLDTATFFMAAIPYYLAYSGSPDVKTICFFSAPVDHSQPIVGSFAGFADGLAHVGDAVYRLYGSRVVHDASGTTITLEGVPYDGFVADGPVTPIGTLHRRPDGSASFEGLPGFGDIHTDLWLTGEGGLGGEFWLVGTDGEVIYGVIALDSQ